MHDVHDRVLRFIEDASSATFGDLALDVFAHQFATIAAYRQVCERQGHTPSSVGDWRAIPPVPAFAFKHVELCCGTAERVFVSSGTTQGLETRSRHFLPDLRLYRASALAGMRQHLFPDVTSIQLLSLIPPVEECPESSLAQMTAWAFAAFAGEDSAVFAGRDSLDFDGLTAALRGAERSGQPICLMTTTAALLRFFDYCRDRELYFRLAHSSRVMDTGGSKGAPRALSRNGLLRAIWNTFAVPGYYAVNEYGMSELSSQYYDNVIRDRWHGRVSHRAKVGPHWMRLRVLDPGTLQDVAAGETGVLCHVDLANAGSAVAVLTEDIGRLTADGFEILGRVTGAEARGCSLALSDYLVR